MKSERNKVLGRRVLGSYLILIGLLIFAVNLGFEVSHVVRSYWPILLLVAGGAKLLSADREARSEGFWLMLAGLYCWVSVWNLWGLSWGTAWPIFLVAGGLSMILEPWLGSGRSCGEERRGERAKGVHDVG